MKTASGKSVLWATLGSCIAICLYDPITKLGGMVHIIMPSFEDAKNVNSPPTRYADSAIPLLLYNMLSFGCKKEEIYAKIAGGAQMFQRSSESAMSAIGKNNIARVKDVLKDMNIDIKGENTGGDSSMTIYFDLATGELTIKTIEAPDMII
jgi:chemotaxis protein CheD